MAGDIQLTCSDCGQDFTFTAADQAFFQERGYSTPKRCKNCRQAKKNDQGGSATVRLRTGNTCDLFGLRPAYNSAF